MTRAVFFLCCILLAGAPAAGKEFDFDALVKGAESAYAKVEDYVCDFHKKELVGDRMVEETILFKFKKPASYYMKWLSDGAECIYVAGKNGDQLIYHGGGLLNLASVSVDPNGFLAMRDNRHTITDAGLGHILDVVVENYKKSRKDPKSRIVYEGETVVDGRTVRNILAEFPTPDYYAHRIRVRFDRATGLPVSFRVEGWKGEFLEEYRFDKLRLNVGLTDLDFDPGNPEYKFGLVLP
jgi:outer membrane lipoprotein-sorting protein